MSKPARYMEECDPTQPNPGLEPSEGQAVNPNANLDPSESAAGRKLPQDLGTTALVGADARETEDVAKYPDLTFNIDPTPFQARGITMTSVERCYRVSMKALAQADPAWAKFADRPYAEKQARSLENFLGRRLQTQSGYLQPKQVLGETEIGKVLQDLRVELEELNHPVAQLIKKIESNFSESLKGGELRDLTRKILVGSHSTRIVRQLTNLLP